MAFQRVIIKGNIGQDPEVNYMPSGDAVANFSVAVSEKYTTKAGQKQEHTEWFRCAAYGKRGEVIAQYFKKGSGILVEGKMRSNKYTDKNGAERTATQMVVDNFDFVDSGGSSAGQSQQSKPAPQQATTSVPAGVADFDDDIPFAAVNSYP